MTQPAGIAGGFGAAEHGYDPAAMKTTTSELRIPADPAYVLVAKRAAAGFGYLAGLGIEAVDDLVIAVAQACENAIRCADAAGTLPSAQIRLAFRVEDQRLEVQVRSTWGRSEEVPAEEEVRAQARRQAAATARAQAEAEAEAEAEAREAATRDLALRVMGLFVDDCRYRVDARTGGLRVRLTKFRV
jgi:anti-sigma regulatory factor (Ser/Thr protein kinase)